MRFSAQVIVFLSFLFLFLVFKSTPVFAQTAAPQPQNLHYYTQNVMLEVMSSMTCALAGIDAVDRTQKCLGISDGKIGPVESNGGALGAMGNLIAITYNPPLHTADFVRYMAGNFGITKNAYAQEAGIGFQGLTPLMNIWIAFRNITYLLFIILFLIIGFAIMFRIHIDPRTVMTVENQIPKIIVGIILVTFSFAIVGLLIDFMWILTFLSIEVFKTIPGVNLGDSFNQVQGRNVLEVANNIMGAGRFGGLVGVAGTSSGAISSIIASIFQGPGASVIVGMILGAAGAVGGTLLVQGIGTLIGGIVGTTLGGLTGSSALGFVGGLIAFLVIVIALLFALFRLWFTLIKAYVMILIVAVFSPFWVLAGILPGSRLNFTNLLRELGSNLVTFPATIIMFLLGKTFLDIFAGSANGAPFVPPLIGNPGDYRAIR